MYETGEPLKMIKRIFNKKASNNQNVVNPNGCQPPQASATSSPIVSVIAEQSVLPVAVDQTLTSGHADELSQVVTSTTGKSGSEETKCKKYKYLS